MSTRCAACGVAVVDIDAFVVHRNTDDGFALAQYRCPGCGHQDVTGCRGLIADLLDGGVRVLRLVRTDGVGEPAAAAGSIDDQVAQLRRLLDREDWFDVLRGGEAIP